MVRSMLRDAVAPVTVILVLSTVFGATAAAEDITVSPDLAPALPEQIAQHGDHLVWTATLEDPAGGPSVDVVLDRSAGRTTVLPIAAGLTDLDLGPGPGGAGTIAVYSRCAGGSCDVYAFDFAAGAERPVPGASSAAVSEQRPTTWGGRLAFLRGTDVVLGSLAGGAPRRVDRGGVSELELGPAHLAEAYSARLPRGRTRTQLAVLALSGGRARVVQDLPTTRRTQVVAGALTFSGATLTWFTGTRAGCAAPTYRYFTYAPRTRRTRRLAVRAAPLGVRLAPAAFGPLPAACPGA